MKIAVNRCHGVFSLSEAIYKELGIDWDGYGYLSNKDLNIEDNNYEAYRVSPKLIAAIEKVGEEKSGGICAEIEIVEIPDGIKWEISEYDGMESVEEKHRSW